MKKNLIRKLIGGLSLTAVMFTFQACYGTPQDYRYDVYVEGIVKTEEGKPVKGIKITTPDRVQYELSDDEGKFSFYTAFSEDASVKILVEDIDGEENGSFQNQEATIHNVSNNDAFFNIVLKEKTNASVN